MLGVSVGPTTNFEYYKNKNLKFNKWVNIFELIKSEYL